MLDLIVRIVEVAVLLAIAAAIFWQVAGGIADLHGRHRAGMARLRRLRDRDLALDPHATWIRALGRDA
jgi:hypothetical protein